jgi:ABC-2 type transport system permease protein
MNAEATLPRRNFPRLYALEAKYELLKLSRLPAFVLPTLGFAPAFYCLFGFALRGPDQPVRALYLLATYGAFGVMGAALFCLGNGVATERGQGWMLWKRTTPMPLSAYFGAKVAAALVFGAIIVATLFALGAGPGGVRLPLATWSELAAVLIAGAIPFCAVGLALGYVAGPNSAPAIINLVYLPASLCSGLWLPIEMLPRFLQRIAVWLPPYHFGQLALRTIGMARAGGSGWIDAAVLAATAVAGLAAATVLMRRDEGRTYG